MRLVILAIILSAVSSHALAQDSNVNYEQIRMRPEYPSNITKPERWRFIPADRLDGGMIYERLLTSSFIAPFVFRDSDVGTGFGVALTDLNFRSSRWQEFAGLFASYTTEGQKRFAFIWQRHLNQLDVPGGIIQEERGKITLATSYEHSLTRRFFGVGNDTEEESESSYSDESTYYWAQYETPIFGLESNWVTHIAGEFETHDLGSGKVSSAPDTAEAFPSEYDNAKGENLLNLLMGIRWDTRDSQRNPNSGSSIGLNSRLVPYQSSGQTAEVTSVVGSHIIPLPGLFHNGGIPNEENPPTDTLAFSAVVNSTFGDLPFFALPSLGGGNALRGFLPGRFRAKHSWFSGVEYRLWLLPRGISLAAHHRIERLGMALFAEAGALSEERSRLFEESPHWSMGPSLRFTLERHAPFRVDLGFSDEGLQVTARFGYSF